MRPYLYLLVTALTLTISCEKPTMKITMVQQHENPGDDGDDFASEFDDGEMRNMSSFDIVAEMKAGWNLGNSLDVEGPNETDWGNPVTTRALIDEISDRGFNTIRVPITWRFHQGLGPNYIVEEAWLDRVEEVVNYVRANNMYVIVNVHHDDTWIIPTYENGDAVKNRLSKLWTQIANRFKNYSDYVIFETLNEPRYENTPEEWIGGTAEGRDMVNQYHKTSLDAIRATGGNNTSRHIMISTYAASTLPHVLDALVIPNNDNKTIISLHSYFPFPFTLGGTDSTWGTDSDKSQLDSEMNKIKTKFIDNGKAVVLGEWSSGNQNNLSDRLEHATYYAQAAAARGIASVWWDNGNSSVSNDGLAVFNRQNMTWPFGEIADAVIEAYD
ncbi:glycoside hydrolase family 5 protein [Winogradskyella flava]|uniref:Glycoside hydrolase family 5 protein n=1 Tax=Winogradskyella flava TaxID=1884876 RepID=A0A842IXP2_9FLAO|nr:glycoside hydrolase family 5 protein [Winogradskyella flava]MBC2845548.1 glycoside hydrolase family 5 protein [Winogradskyella flava]